MTKGTPGLARPALLLAAFLALAPAACAQSGGGDAPLAGTRWMLVALGGDAERAADEARAPHLVLAPEGGRVSGSDGCNRLVGTYALEGARLAFAGVAATRMACPEGMEQAAAFQRALGATAGHRVSGGVLELLDAAGQGVARLEAARPR